MVGAEPFERDMEAIYRLDGNIAHASAFAGGPWDPRLQHGAAPASLICRTVEQLPTAAPMRVARLTVDLMRPVPLAPLVIETEVLREGRKIQLVQVRLLADGTEVTRATVLRIRRDERDLPTVTPEPRLAWPQPEDCPDPTESGLSRTPFLDGLDMKLAHGSFRTPGPGAVWFRARRPIVDGEAISPLMRAAIAADFCNGTSAELDFAHWTFINGDLTLSLAREPVGDWILLDAETWTGPDSIGIAAARLADRNGYFGRAVQSVLFEKR